MSVPVCAYGASGSFVNACDRDASADSKYCREHADFIDYMNRMSD